MILRWMAQALVWAVLAGSALAQAPQKTVHDVQLDSGITLADWLSLPAQKAAEPSLEVGAQAASYVQRYGPFRELLDVVKRAAAAKRYDGSGMKPESAARHLAQVEEARRLLGDWPALLLTQARALATLNDLARARQVLVAWMGVVPGSEPNRAEIVELLVSSQENLEAVAQWNQRRLQQEADARMRRERQQLAEAAERQRMERERLAAIEERSRKEREMKVACAATKGGLIAAGNGVLKQCDSGLDWTQSDNGDDVDWHEANAYCQRKGNGWRLPTSSELQSLYAPELPGKVCWNALFVFHLCNVSPLLDLETSAPWSSERNGAAEVWRVSLTNGKKYSVDMTEPYGARALCVR